MTDGFEPSVLVTQHVESSLLHRTVPLPPGSANASPQATASPLPVVANKVLLEHSHAHSFMYCLWLPWQS